MLVVTSFPAMYASLFDTSVQPITPGGWILCFWIVSTANWSAAVFSLRNAVARAGLPSLSQTPPP